MLTGAEFKSGLAVRWWLAGRLVQHQAIDPGAEGVVRVGFEIGWSQRPVGAVGFHLGEGFGFGLFSPVDMRGGGGLLQIQPHHLVGVVSTSGVVVHPEFTGGEVAAA